MFVALNPSIKYSLTLLFLMSWIGYLPAQDIKIDELKKQLTNIHTDTGRVNLFYELGKQYEEANLDSCLYFLSQSLNIAQKIDAHTASANAMYRIGYAYMYHANNDDKALQWLKRAIKLAKSKNDYKNLSQCYLLLGIISIHQHIDNPNELLNISLQYAVKSNDWITITECYGMIASYFAQRKEYRKAIEANLKAMEISKKHDIDIWLSQGLDLCDLYEAQGNFTQSFLLAKKLNTFKEKLKMSKGYFVYINDLGRLETKLKNYKKAEILFLNILDEEKQKAKTDTFHLYHIFKHLEALYLAQGDYKKAYKAAHDISDTRLWLAQKRQSRDSQIQMTKLKAASDLDKKEVQINLLAVQKKKQLLFLVAAIMIAVLLIGFVIILQRNKNKIEQQKTELSQLNKTKDKLFSIIAHDLRGPIASTKGVLALFDDNSLSKDEFIELSKDLQQNVNNIHTMLENLLLWSLSQMEGIKPKPRLLIINELVDETISLFKEIAHQKQIQLQREFNTNFKNWLRVFIFAI